MKTREQFLSQIEGLKVECGEPGWDGADSIAVSAERLDSLVAIADAVGMVPQALPEKPADRTFIRARAGLSGQACHCAASSFRCPQ